MSENKIVLTPADEKAISARDAVFLLNKGSALYAKGDYKNAGQPNIIALPRPWVTIRPLPISDMFIYTGRATEPNLSIAMGYFKIAAAMDNVDGAYKLGDIYGSDKWGVIDTELSLYYYRMAAALLIDGQCDPDNVIECDSLKGYPSLCFALGRGNVVEGQYGNQSFGVISVFKTCRNRI